jgi:gamma-glutamyltranspeptidase/glutathione hydrolase
VQPDLMTSGLHIVTRRNGILEGGADPRREGVAVGD